MILRTFIAAAYIVAAIWLVWTDRATGIAGWIVLGVGLLALLAWQAGYRPRR